MFDCIPVHLALAQLKVGSAGFAVEVEGERVRREELTEGDGGVEVPDGDDMLGADPEAFHLSGDETPEGIVPHARDDAGPMSEASSRDGDVRRASSEELSKGFDVLEVGADLERKDVDAGAPHCQDVCVVLIQGHASSFLFVGVCRARRSKDALSADNRQSLSIQ